jgi:CBS domain-containing protein
MKGAGPRSPEHKEKNDMRPWRVQNVMTSDVITASADAPLAELVTLLTERQISAVPIVDDFGVVLGMVSWTDLHEMIEIAPADPPRWWRRWTPPRLSWPEGTAAGVMTGPPLTIGADATLPVAARLMHRHGVGRLLVVDADHKLRGVLSRSDLFKVHDRLDAVIRDEVMRRVLVEELRIRPGEVRVTVDDGAVTLTGRTARRTTALAAARMTELVAGVTGVDNQLTSDMDDTPPGGGARQATVSLRGKRRRTCVPRPTPERAAPAS